MGFHVSGVATLLEIRQVGGVIKIRLHPLVLILQPKERVTIHIIAGGRQIIGVTLQVEEIAQLRPGEREVFQMSQEIYKMTGILDAIYLMSIRQNAITF